MPSQSTRTITPEMRRELLAAWDEAVSWNQVYWKLFELGALTDAVRDAEIRAISAFFKASYLDLAGPDGVAVGGPR